MRTFLVLAGLLIAAHATHARADVIHVPGDQPIIQAAIDLANPGDEVVVGDGTWSGVGNVGLAITEDIVLCSASGSPLLCVLDGGSSSRIATLSSTTTATLRGLGITVRSPGARHSNFPRPPRRQVISSHFHLAHPS